MGRPFARQLAQQAIAQGKPLSWFETLYRAAQRELGEIPWADQCINPHLQSWLGGRSELPGQRALVVGCGLGDDAEGLAAQGLEVTAFDIAPTAIAECRQRFPHSTVGYEVADILAPPATWQSTFDFVFEAYTLQVLPRPLRLAAMRQIASALAPGGTLLVVTRLRNPDSPEGEMPWPLTPEECGAFAAHGLRCIASEDFWDQESPPVRRMRAEWTLPR